MLIQDSENRFLPCFFPPFFLQFEDDDATLGIYLLKAPLLFLFLWRFESPQKYCFFIPRMVRDFLRCKEFPSEHDVNVPKLSYWGLKRTYPLHQAANEKKWRIMVCLMNFGANPQQILGIRFFNGKGEMFATNFGI